MNTGNATVDRVGEMNFWGNIIPQTWYKTIRRDSGKPYLTAIVILSDVVYWYRPTEIRDENTGTVTAYKKKFAADKLQRSYQQIADMFGISKREATDAVVFLEELGVIKREFRKINVNGVVCNNVLFIGLNPERLKEITYDPTGTGTPIPLKSDSPHAEKGEVGTESRGTYTKTTTKTTQRLPNKKREKAPFVPPTLEEIKAYCKERNNNVEAQRFYDYFTASNWVDSKGNKVKNWKQKVITWEAYTTEGKNNDESNRRNPGPDRIGHYI